MAIVSSIDPSFIQKLWLYDFYFIIITWWPLMTSSRSNKVTVRWVLYQVWFIISWVDNPVSFIAVPKYAPKLCSYHFYCTFWVWDDLWWPVKGQNSQYSYYFYIKSCLGLFYLQSTKFSCNCNQGRFQGGAKGAFCPGRHFQGGAIFLVSRIFWAGEFFMLHL